MHLDNNKTVPVAIRDLFFPSSARRRSARFPRRYRGRRSVGHLLDDVRADLRLKRTRWRAFWFRTRHTLHRASQSFLQARRHPTSPSRPQATRRTSEAQHQPVFRYVLAGCASTAVLAGGTLLYPVLDTGEDASGVKLNRATLLERGALRFGVEEERATPFRAEPPTAEAAAPPRLDPGWFAVSPWLADPAIAEPQPAERGAAEPEPSTVAMEALSPVGREAPAEAPTLAGYHPGLLGHLMAPRSTLEDPGFDFGLEMEHAPSADWKREEIRVRSGDTFARIMSRAGFDTRLVHEIVTSSDEARRFRHLRPGHRLIVYRDDDGDLAALHFPFDQEEELRVTRRTDGDERTFDVEVAQRNLRRELVRAESEIQHSLYRAARRAGLTDRLIMQLTSVFGWEVDLGRELRRGHRFRILYEEIDDGDEEPVVGDIVAAKLIMGDRVVEAVRFTDGDGRTDYYTPEGESLRREFKRHPVEYRRISSPFDRNRRHPVLGVRRPHLGVDYAAPTGTPIRAAGEGRVIRRGWRGGYGRVVKIEHGSRYRTVYAHMSRFADGVRQGDRVERGQVIGYVGRSGLATGAHLHYEFIVNGQHRDPLEVELPKADSLAEQHQDRFNEHKDTLLGALRADDAPQRIALSGDFPYDP